MKIRQFKFDADLVEVCRLWSESEPGVHLSPSDEPQEIQKKLKQDPELFLVAEEDGNIVGTVLGGFDGRRGMVYHLAVNSANRRKGIGTALMQELEARFRSKGCRKYYLLVQKQAQDAFEFYKKFGCEVMDLHLLGKRVL
jgi:ribosomal protein S18 acetylase RimI-like enzyme